MRQNNMWLGIYMRFISINKMINHPLAKLTWAHPLFISSSFYTILSKHSTISTDCIFFLLERQWNGHFMAYIHKNRLVVVKCFVMSMCILFFFFLSLLKSTLYCAHLSVVSLMPVHGMMFSHCNHISLLIK